MRYALFTALLFILPIHADGPQRQTIRREGQSAWYTQIGAWHLLKDSVTARGYLFHDHAVDGARSGQAVSDCKFNRKFEKPKRIRMTFSLGKRPSSAGVLLKDKALAYYFVVERRQRGDSLRIIKRFEKKYTSVGSFGVQIADTVDMVLALHATSLRISVGNTEKGITRPPDLPDRLTVGLACQKGSVRVWDMVIESPTLTVDESFDNATMINLGLERMFKGKAK